MSSLKTWMARFSSAAQPGPSLGFDLIRVYLGIGLFVRGLLFVSQPDRVFGYLSSTESWFVSYAVAHYVAVAHLGGGVLLAVGMATRLAAVVQLPILVGAVFMVHSGDALLNAGQSLEFSALVLALLCVYLCMGSGRFSVDAWLGDRISLLGDEPRKDESPASHAAQP